MEQQKFKFKQGLTIQELKDRFELTYAGSVEIFEVDKGDSGGESWSERCND